eukprot:gene8829-9733_t
MLGELLQELKTVCYPSGSSSSSSRLFVSIEEAGEKKSLWTKIKDRFFSLLLALLDWLKRPFTSSLKKTSSSTSSSSSSEVITVSAASVTVATPRITSADKLAQARKYAEDRIKELKEASKKLVVHPPPPPATTTALDKSSIDYPGVTSRGYAGVAEPGRWPPLIQQPPARVKTVPRRSLASLTEADLKGKRVLVRCDLNVPLNGVVITDDTRIRASLPTINYLRQRGAKVLLASHLGRPKGGGYEAKYSLAPIAERLSRLLQCNVPLVPDCKGLSVAAASQAMKEGEVALLENVRFYPEEEKNDPSFAQALASNADLYVNDAFGTAHRAHASTEGVAAYLHPAVAGFLLEKELTYLQGMIESPLPSSRRPFAAIIGGSKVSSKITVIETLLEDKVDKLVLGGGMVFTFLKARGWKIGNSLVEDDQLDLARRLETLAKERNVELILADDVVIANRFANDAEVQVVDVEVDVEGGSGGIPDGWMGLDIGPKTIHQIEKVLSDCQMILWNGPMGVFEFPTFAKGTNAVAEILAKLTTEKQVTTIIGGGDSVAAVEKAGLAEKMSHISTGGGASLELLEGKVLPGIAALDPAVDDNATTTSTATAAA